MVREGTALRGYARYGMLLVGVDAKGCTIVIVLGNMELLGQLVHPVRDAGLAMSRSRGLDPG